MANGQAFVFNSIIAVVIGGVLLTGGYGSVVGVVLGTLTFAIVGQGIYYTGWNSDWASLILGVLLLIAVLMNNTFRRMALSYSPAQEEGLTMTAATAQADQHQQVLRHDGRPRWTSTSRCYPGEVLCLLGDNGAGKSTLIKILSGFHEPTSGTMEIDGKPVAFK